MSGTTSNAVTYGVTATGFVAMRQVDCQAAIVASINAKMAVITGDPSFQVDTRPDSVLGQIIMTFAEREATFWEVAAALYASYYPVSASNVSLDNAVTFSGVTRLQQTQTTVWGALYGAEGTLVPFGATASLASTQEYFSLSSAVQITQASVIDVSISVVTVTPRASYSVIINNLPYGYIASVSDGSADILVNLATALATSGLPVTLVSMFDGGPVTQVRVQAIGHAAFSISVSTNLSLDRIGSPGLFVANDYGPVSVIPGDLSLIPTVISGWTGVSNPQSGITGHDQESDAELRSRYQIGVYQFGSGVLPAITANLLSKVPGVTAAKVIPNNGDTPLDSGQPPHSIQCVVQGGDDLSVATLIFNQVAAGIATWGTTMVEVDIASGGAYMVGFTRPQNLYIWVQVQTYLLTEESFPANGLAAVAQAVLSTGSSLSAGADVVVQRFLGPIYSSVSGIAQMDVKVASNTDPNFSPQPSDFSAANIAVSDTQIANFDLSRIMVS